MSSVTMKQLLEAGVHFGHQSRRWNPKMKPYIYTDRNGIYIIDLKKTLRLLRDATKYVRECVIAGNKVMFVGTKKQAKEIIQEGASAANMYYVNNRWLGGLLTNFRTVRKSIDRLNELDRMFTDGSIEKYSKKEQSMYARERQALEKNLGGIKHMDRLPDLIFIIDPSKEQIAVQEAKKLNIPIVAVVDTNCDPDPIDFVIPANDDAIRSIKLMVSQISDACVEGVQAREGGLGDLTPEQIAALPAGEELEGQFYSEEEKVSVSGEDQNPEQQG
ncbi:MAG TPA: 30S ribosomal protein S2 [Candidatus Sumerlaeota bacterium]|nr:30S ribosomal protein S2 [Candidatus Sumerlaeota bacterium]